MWPWTPSNLTNEEAVAILRRLSERFKIRVPIFRFNRTSRGLYYPGSRTVTISRRYSGKRTAIHSLLHEFAHHLADERCRDKRQALFLKGVPANELPKLPHHGPPFRDALWDVVTAYYGDPAKYVWETEYASIRAWAARKLKVSGQPTLCPVMAERKLYTKFDGERAVVLFRNHVSVSAIARMLNGGRTLGHTRNLVRAALRKDGL